MAQILMGAQGIGELPTDRQRRVQRGKRILKDHADLAAAQHVDGAIRQRSELLAAEQDAATGDPRAVVAAAA